MAKIKTQKTKNTTIESGTCRIEEIKSTISSLKPQVCKAEVYETWDNIFETTENDQ
ncbi:MAG: hypothetical protein M1324_02775 [Patescibacteria group bacterium]|nr:hypothetical protein [Patescibacteria group bacterium]